MAWSGSCTDVVAGGRGDGGGDTAVLGTVGPEFGVARGTCAVEIEGVGGPDDDGDSGSVTQSLAMSVSVSYQPASAILPMRSSRDELCNRVGQGRARVHMENREGVFAFDQAAGG